MRVNPPSPMEQRVYQLMREYLTNNEIALKLHINKNTVRTYVQRIYKRHEVVGRLEFLRKFREEIA